MFIWFMPNNAPICHYIVVFLVHVMPAYFGSTLGYNMLIKGRWDLHPHSKILRCPWMLAHHPWLVAYHWLLMSQHLWGSTCSSYDRCWGIHCHGLFPYAVGLPTSWEGAGSIAALDLGIGGRFEICGLFQQCLDDPTLGWISSSLVTTLILPFLVFWK